MPEKTFKFTVAQSGYSLDMLVRQIGPDLLISVTGGTNPHIGVVTTLAPGLKTQTVRFLSPHEGFHKEDLITERIAAKISPSLTRNCVITAGVHVNYITKKQIAAAGPMSDKLGEQLLLWLKSHPENTSKPIYKHPE